MTYIKLKLMFAWTWLRARFGDERAQIVCDAVVCDECDEDTAECIHREASRYPPDGLVDRIRWTHGVHGPFADVDD